jgi:hypothetical protein
MNLEMTIRTECFEVFTGMIFVVSVAVMNCEMMQVFIAAFFAAELAFALNRNDVATNPIVEPSRLVCVAHGATTRAKGNMLGVDGFSTKFARARWWGVVFMRAAPMRFRGTSFRAELRRRIPRPSDSRKRFIAAFAFIASFACLLVFNETFTRTKSTGQVWAGFCKFFSAPPANMNSLAGSPRVIRTLGRAKLRLFCSFITPRKWLRAVFAAVDRIEVVTLPALPGVPAFSGTESGNNTVRPLRKGVAALFAFVNFPAAFLAQSETVDRTEPRFFGVMVGCHKGFLAPLTLAQWEFS